LPIGSRAQDAIVVAPSIPSLAHWGRSADADLIYRTLITFGPATVSELHRDVGMPLRRIVAGVDELASIGAIASHSPTSRREPTWIPKPPATVLASLRRIRRAELELSTAGQSPPPVTAQLLASSQNGRGGLRHLRTRALTRARLAELNAVAVHEHLAMNPERAFDAAAAKPAVHMDRLVLSRGVRMRVVGVHAYEPDPLISHGRRPAEPRPDYRATASLPMKLIVVDRKIAFFPVDPDNIELGYLEVAQQPVVSALVGLFERHWESARDPWEWAVPQIALNPREEALVTLLTKGHTDASAARHLRVSPRTVTAILRGLMDRLGAENRFQLGLALGTLRAVAPPTVAPANTSDQETT
jgi:DNA-binding CsgD family transcriptional regulator